MRFLLAVLAGVAVAAPAMAENWQVAATSATVSTTGKPALEYSMDADSIHWLSDGKVGFRWHIPPVKGQFTVWNGAADCDGHRFYQNVETMPHTSMGDETKIAKDLIAYACGHVAGPPPVMTHPL